MSQSIVCEECGHSTMVRGQCLNPLCSAHSKMTTMTVSTRHPEDYELINHHDGTHWVIVNGTWMSAEWKPRPDWKP